MICVLAMPPRVGLNLTAALAALGVTVAVRALCNLHVLHGLHFWPRPLSMSTSFTSIFCPGTTHRPAVTGRARLAGCHYGLHTLRTCIAGACRFMPEAMLAIIERQGMFLLVRFCRVMSLLARPMGQSCACQCQGLVAALVFLTIHLS